VITHLLIVLTPKPSHGHAGELVRACHDGLLNSLIRQLPGYLSLNVLLSSKTPNQNESEVLLIVFFQSLELAVGATESPMGQCIFRLLLDRMSSRTKQIGLFSCPVKNESAGNEACSPNAVFFD
jgi:hypothetical protein